MITTTEAWRRTLGCYNVYNRDYIVPANDIKIEYEQIDADAQNNASVSTNSSISFSDHSEIMNLNLDYSEEKRVATLEPNEWVLDGSTVNIGTNTHAGWVSNIESNADGTFDTNPVLTLTWSDVQTKTIPGVSIWWSTLLNEWATEFKVTAYKNDSAVFTQTFSNGVVNNFYEGAFTGYDKVSIEIIKWCVPYHRARIENVLMGFTVYIGKSEILKLEQNLNSDLLSFALPDDSITFSIDNVSEEWNPDNPTGRYAYLFEKQRITVKYAFEIDGSYEWYTFGTYFMSEWTTPQNGISAEFTGRSLVEFMTTDFDPTQISGYTFGNSITLKRLAECAFAQSNLPTDIDGSVKWSVDSSLADISVVIPYSSSSGTNTYNFQHTCAEVIQLCANAGCCTIRPNVEGDIIIAPSDQTIGDYYIDRFVAYDNGEYELTKALKSITLNDTYTFTPSESVAEGEIQTISNELIQNQSVANSNGAWISDILLKRRDLDGEFRADPRLQPLDVITVVNKYARNRVYITDVKWTYSGAFKGYYKGKVLKTLALVDEYADLYAGYAYSGEYGGDS